MVEEPVAAPTFVTAAILAVVKLRAKDSAAVPAFDSTFTEPVAAVKNDPPTRPPVLRTGQAAVPALLITWAVVLAVIAIPVILCRVALMLPTPTKELFAAFVIVLPISVSCVMTSPTR